MPDQQMRSETMYYPVDKYLADKIKTFEMVNIDDNIWEPEPDLRPADEIALRKLHEMLQSTAEDLKLLSGELLKFHESDVQVKTLPSPLDEDFNEKVRIKELVDAKFHGYKLVDNPAIAKQIKVIKVFNKNINNPMVSEEKSSSIKVNKCTTNIKNPLKKLGFSKTRLVQIKEIESENSENNKDIKSKLSTNSSVDYKEYSYDYVDSQNKVYNLTKQEMPKVNIRNELVEQKVLQLDIFPDSKILKESSLNRNNVTVVAIHQENLATQVNNILKKQSSNPAKSPKRVMATMSVGSTDSTCNSLSLGTKQKLGERKIIHYKRLTSKKNRAQLKSEKPLLTPSKQRRNVSDWKKNLNVIYGCSKSSKEHKPKHDLVRSSSSSLKKQHTQESNDLEYIPYSHLTIGGVRVSDIENEILNFPEDNDAPLTPILNKILSTRVQKKENQTSSKTLTTSDENLLQEVLDIEEVVSKTISDNMKQKNLKLSNKYNDKEQTDNDDTKSYADDFEQDNSENSMISNTNNQIIFGPGDNINNNSPSEKSDGNNSDINKTYSLSKKNTGDVINNVHTINVKDNSTQTKTLGEKTLKESQTSPIKDKTYTSTIGNELCPLEPFKEIDKMFKMEKDLIKQIILKEYGELIENNLNKPSTSNYLNQPANSNLVQRPTQTSPAHVKSIMTSPVRVKTRSTSPFTMSLSVNRHTSPIVAQNCEEVLKEPLDNENDKEDWNITINLSSPRFKLRLPQSSDNIHANNSDGIAKLSPQNNSPKTDLKLYRKYTSSSSPVQDYSSSDLSSLGEFQHKKNKHIKTLVSESSSTSSLSKISSDIQSDEKKPSRSEGEISLSRYFSKKQNKSEGELSSKRK